MADDERREEFVCRHCGLSWSDRATYRAHMEEDHV